MPLTPRSPLRPLLVSCLVLLGTGAAAPVPEGSAPASTVPGRPGAPSEPGPAASPAASPSTSSLPAPSAPAAPAAASPAVDDGRAREWIVDDLVPYLDELNKGRNYQQGLKLFKDLVCGNCHSFGRHSQGGGYAPDLTPVGTKLTRDILVREILDPSFEIDDRFYATVFKLKDGKTVEGAIVAEAEGTYTVAPALLALRTTMEVKESDIVSREPSTVSQMPAGMLNGSTREQILDLLAFLESRGESDAAAYRK